ncbi:hypothetical protein G3I67_10670 [Orrella sp. NBD-18]|uniref:Type I restriction modification DNA specificity domain-containing protein n=1 Tax=Sheuella amnicola TaxID=2707330 RepID=A0A6B2QYL2_9BURK|nr:restriction endonuclease subunit S [Sheuella amnicola]NDY83696.1 hypothetical protein [Sheuella amnicola]
MSDWREVRISELSTIDIGGTPSRAIPSFWAEKSAGYAWISIADLKGKYVCETKEHITALGVRSSNVKLIPANTTVMSFKLTVGRTAITGIEMFCNEAIAIFQPKDDRLNGQWLYHALPRAATSVVTDTAVKGATLNKAKMAEMTLNLPPPEEQAKIAQILDTLDTAIHETEAIIVKLKAVKQGLLHDLLTRGIDANGELRLPQTEVPHLYKESPLGWIPKEWDVVTLESVSNTVTSGSRDWARFYSDSGALFVRIGNLTREHINFRYESTMYVRPPRNADGQRTRLESGDILISITADLGIIGVVPDGLGETYINQHIALVRPDLEAVNSRFVGHYLAGPVAQTYISKLNDAGAKAGLNLPTIRGLVTAMPLRPEQDQIAARLDEIDNRIQNATTESAKLRELKAGLMDDLLTGRVRVTPLLAEAAQQQGSA